MNFESRILDFARVFIHSKIPPELCKKCYSLCFSYHFSHTIKSIQNNWEAIALLNHFSLLFPCSNNHHLQIKTIQLSITHNTHFNNSISITKETPLHYHKWVSFDNPNCEMQINPFLFLIFSTLIFPQLLFFSIPISLVR